jgi:hypothetical protein
MGADFSKFQRVFWIALQILPADNLKGYRMQRTMKSQHEKRQEQMGWNYSVFDHLPLLLLNSKDLLRQNKSDYIQLSWFLCLSKMEQWEAYGKL